MSLIYETYSTGKYTVHSAGGVGSGWARGESSLDVDLSTEAEGLSGAEIGTDHDVDGASETDAAELIGG